VQLALTEPQEDFVFSPAPMPAMVAGLGAGKSQAGMCRLLIKMLAKPGINTGYYMPTYDLLRRRAMPGTEEILGNLGLTFQTNKSDYIIAIAGYGEMIFRSYDRPERIIAYEVAHSLVDEIDTLPKDKAAQVWRKVSERNRQKCGEPNTIGCVTTPDQGLGGFVYSKWGKNPAPGYTLIKASTLSNPYLPDGYVDQIRANYDPILAEMYINGDFVSLSRNKVYTFFDRKKHHTDRTLTDSDTLLCVGLDFNVGGTCATIWIIEGGKPIAVNEFVCHDTQDFILTISRYRMMGRKITVYPDASGRARSTNASLTDVQMIEQAGFNVDAPDANPMIRNRVNCVNALLSHDRMLVNTDACPLLTNALETQGYDAKGEPEKFADHPAIDDWTDGAGYFLNRRFPIERPVSTMHIKYV